MNGKTEAPGSPHIEAEASTGSTPPGSGAPDSKAVKPKTAVIVIHGIGEQWPMDTLRGFVEAAWSTDPDLSEAWSEGETYSKPERITGNFELRRITTRYWKAGEAEAGPAKRVDFFEFYWAYLMRGNTFGAVFAWLLRLLLRGPGRVPNRLLGGWIFGLFLLAAGLVLAILTAVRPDLSRFGIPAWSWAVLAAAGAGFSALWLRPVAGDAARYLSPSPGNVEARQEIREAGIDLVTKLTASGQYDRIIIAGHSLGAIIGYDVLHYAWSRIDDVALKAAHGASSGCMKALGNLEKAAGVLTGDTSPPHALPSYRDRQRIYFDALAKARDTAGHPLWLVSDFVTLGAPLSSADLLLAKDRNDLDRRIAMRELPESPPRAERAMPLRFSYPPGEKSRIPHHGAVFAPVVWTNIYYPHVLGVIGDFVSGPVADLLGKAIRDVRVPIGFPTFRHLSYWAKPKKAGPAIRALRHALNLKDRNEAKVWTIQANLQTVRAERLPGGSKAFAKADDVAKTEPVAGVSS